MLVALDKGAQKRGREGKEQAHSKNGVLALDLSSLMGYEPEGGYLAPPGSISHIKPLGVHLFPEAGQ